MLVIVSAITEALARTFFLRTSRARRASLDMRAPYLGRWEPRRRPRS